MLKSKPNQTTLSKHLAPKLGRWGTRERWSLCREEIKEMEKKEKKNDKEEPKEIWTRKLPQEYYGIRKYSRKIYRCT